MYCKGQFFKFKWCLSVTFLSLVDFLNIVIASSGFALSIVCIWLAYSSVSLNKSTKRLFVVIAHILLLYTFSDILSQYSLFQINSDYVLLSTIGVYCESFFSGMLMPILSIVLIIRSAETVKRNPLLIISSVIFLIYVCLLTSNLFTGFFYYFTNDNIYQRGRGYLFLLFPPALSMLTNTIGLIKRWRKLSKNDRIGFVFCIGLPFICMLIQMFSYGLLLIVAGTSAAIMIMFILVIKIQNEELKKKETALLVSQISPHFVYNTLTNIYYLCDIDPKKAKSAINSFTGYLRSNFSALRKDELIPFEKELEHTKAYLDIVKVRYEDLVFVEYDTPCVDFRLPALTLEPIVENCVKHGVDPELDPLHINVRTYIDGAYNVISVTDDGVGYKPANDDEPHVGLANVRNRLKSMCKGTLDISSGKDNKGTTVTVKIPRA